MSSLSSSKSTNQNLQCYLPCTSKGQSRPSKSKSKSESGVAFLVWVDSLESTKSFESFSLSLTLLLQWVQKRLNRLYWMYIHLFRFHSVCFDPKLTVKKIVLEVHFFQRHVYGNELTVR